MVNLNRINVLIYLIKVMVFLQKYYVFKRKKKKNFFNFYLFNNLLFLLFFNLLKVSSKVNSIERAKIILKKV